MTVMFSDLGLLPHLLRAVEALGFTTPTPIQERALPAALAGRDVVASANTGTGKTAAFVLPALQRLSTHTRAEASWGPRVLVLTPTRELAAQVLEGVRDLSKFERVQAGAILGGMPYRQQLEMLRRRVDIVVATPGRLIDHLERGRIDLSGVEILVLDEADRMLDMGFRDAVEQIAAACPAERQTLMFTATLDGAAERLARTLTREPERIDVAGRTVVTTQIDQRFLRTDGLEHKHKVLGRLLADTGEAKGIVFVATKADAANIADKLCDEGHAARPLHGDMDQRDRNRMVQALRDGRIRLIVATDVAARGIDIVDLGFVVNFDLPRQAEDYVHRIGRTGRAGATGTAWSLFTRHEWRQVRAIEDYTGAPAVQHALEGLEPMPERKPERHHRPAGGRPGGGGYRGKPSHGSGHAGKPGWGHRAGGEARGEFRGEARPDQRAEPRSEHRTDRAPRRDAGDRAPRRFQRDAG